MDHQSFIFNRKCYTQFKTSVINVLPLLKLILCMKHNLFWNSHIAILWKKMNECIDSVEWRLIRWNELMCLRWQYHSVVNHYFYIINLLYSQNLERLMNYSCNSLLDSFNWTYSQFWRGLVLCCETEIHYLL